MKFKKITILIFSSLISCATQNIDLNSPEKANALFIVDCLLPGQIRKLGQVASYVTARRAIKTSASDCEIRGGEYVAYDRANYQTALNIWLPKAQAGDPQAQNYVGEIYDKGLGIKPDYDLAFVWYKKAALQGYSKAQLNLGYLYERGLGVKQDKALAMEWYGKSSNLARVNIPYAATLTSEQDSNSHSTELSLLKTELNNSRTESKTLKHKLAAIQQQLLTKKSRLAALEIDLNRVKNKIRNEQNLTKNDPTIASLKKTLDDKNRALVDQQQNILALENEYKSKLNSLAEKLDETQKRAGQLLSELKNSQQQNKQSQVNLLNAEKKLAETEKQLLSINNQSADQFNYLNTASNNSLSQAETKLQQTQQKILHFQQEKQKNTRLIEQLKAENKRIKVLETSLQDQIKHDGLSKNKLARLNDQLQQQKKQSAQTQKKLLLTQQQLNQHQLEYTRLLANLQGQLEQVKQEKLLLAEQKNTEQQEKELYFKDLTLKNKEIEQLKNKLIAEKQHYEQQIKTFRQQANNLTTTQKPKIEIIDPAIVVTRGSRVVNLRSLVKQREIIGKVDSPVDLLSLTINDRKKNVNKQGIFKTDIKLNGIKTPVQIIAVDKNGTRAMLNFMLSTELAKNIDRPAQATTTTQDKQAWKQLNFGTYHALIIANNDYKKVPGLDTPIIDGQVIEKVLRTRYNFKTKLLTNGTRYQILSELNQLRATLSKDDNLLIYYAGHGELDKVNMRGHWLPVDADGDNTANWISTVAITDILNAMSVKHVMVVSDSCYSGAMTRSSLARLDAGLSNKQRHDWLKAMLKTRSRTVLTSGGLKPVMDGGGGQHSVFANAFIKALENNSDLLEGQALYREVANNIVAVAADYGIEQVPEYAPIRHAGHESGEFFFVPN